ncbi:MAG: hypothetical protein R3C14_22685 [Caldilineaceae bacterium]
MKRIALSLLLACAINALAAQLVSAQDTYPPDARIEQVCDQNTSRYTCADIYDMYAYSRSYYYAVEVQAAQGQAIDYDAARDYAKQQAEGYNQEGRYQSERNLWQPSPQQRQQWQARRAGWNRNGRGQR